MLFKLILYIFLFWLISRFIRGMFLPSTRQNRPFNLYHEPNNRRKNLDQIEDADFEDLSEKN